MSIQPNALVLNAPGINCNIETGFALEQAGANVEQVHISQLRDGDRRFADYEILALSGGFSFGDDIASGRILGLELKKRFPEELNRFVEAGKAIIGICNGFQVLVESGLLPEGEITEDRKKVTSLVHNKNDKFECRWSKLVVEPSASFFVSSSDIRPYIELPVAHQEGKLVSTGAFDIQKLYDNDQVVLSYIDECYYEVTEEYPDNPNGSKNGITGICNVDGNILGMMPHPERYITRTQHPNWRRGEGNNPFGAVIFKGIVDYAKDL
jgi:phosphoribosylformylglycinamidine synthase subunit PurQ / glutaminase